MTVLDTLALQCSLKGAVFGHSWQKFQEGVPKIQIIEDLTLKLNKDGAPIQYINIWIEQMGTSLNIQDYYTMVSNIVFQCLQSGGV